MEWFSYPAELQIYQFPNITWMMTCFCLSPSSSRETMEEFLAAAEALAFELLHAVAESLGLPPTYFDRYFVEHSGDVRLNYYPVCPQPQATFGVGRHKDTGVLTVLTQVRGATAKGHRSLVQTSSCCKLAVEFTAHMRCELSCFEVAADMV